MRVCELTEFHLGAGGARPRAAACPSSLLALGESRCSPVESSQPPLTRVVPRAGPLFGETLAFHRQLAPYVRAGRYWTPMGPVSETADGLGDQPADVVGRLS